MATLPFRILAELQQRIYHPIPMGESYKFINETYMGVSGKGLQIGDECIIHPVEGRSQATKSYPVVITANTMNWCKGEYPNTIPCPKVELCIRGIRENTNWHGAVLNEYGFSRLEFVRRNIQ